MSDTSRAVMSVRQAAELDHALARNGWKAAEIKKLGAGDTLTRVRYLLQNKVYLANLQHIIDCDTDPDPPDRLYDGGWVVAEHQKRGLWMWNSSVIDLYFAYSKCAGRIVPGHEVRIKLGTKSVLNANVLDYLLKNQQLLPQDLKKDKEGRVLNIFFWGTVYRRSDALKPYYVRYLYWNGEMWECSQRSLDDAWGRNDLAPALYE